MPDDGTTCWTVPVSKETDAALRTHLAGRGLDESDLPRFVEEAVRWRVFDQTIAEVRETFAGIAEDRLSDIVAEAVAATRASRRTVG